MKATASFVTLVLCTFALCNAIDLPDNYKVYDYVVIGGGGAGCVMARRLSDDSSKTVLVLNYGQNTPCPICDNTTSQSNIGQGLFTVDGDDYFSTPQLFRTRSVREIRTGLPGGATRYYGGVAIPSSKGVFDTQWPAGYDYETVRPYMNKWQDHFCHYLDPNVTGINEADCLRYHGEKGGPMSLSPPSRGRDYDTAKDFFKATPEFNFNAVPDPYNPAFQHGDYAFPLTRFHNRANPYDINSTRTRDSTWTAFLPASLRNARRNLNFEWEAQARELVFLSDLNPIQRVLLGYSAISAGKPKAVGVAYLKDDAIKYVFARKQIVLSAGIEGTPKFLQLNGIGPADLLTANGIKVVANNPAVGQNLAVHQAVALSFQTKMPVPTSTNSNGDVINLIMTSPYNQGFPDMEVEVGFGIFVRSIDPTLTGLEEPYLTTPASPEGYFPFMSAIVTVTNPTFRGTVNITGPKYTSPSQVNYGWPSSAQDYAGSVDYQKMTWGFERVRGIFTGNNSFANKWVQSELSPGPSPLPDSVRDLFYSAQFQHSVYHLTGSASLGKATDLNGRVNGVSGLTICDNSLIPHPPNGNPSSTMMALCEIIAEKVKGHNLL